MLYPGLVSDKCQDLVCKRCVDHILHLDVYVTKAAMCYLLHLTVVLRETSYEDKRGGKFTIELGAKITKCGAISPRFRVSNDEYTFWERQYLPAYNRGMLLVTTNQGVMSHHTAAEKGIGGFLIGYVF